MIICVSECLCSGSAMPLVEVMSSEGETLPVELELARRSITIRTMLEDMGLEVRPLPTTMVHQEGEVIPITCVRTATLKLVFQWLEHHKVHFSS